MQHGICRTASRGYAGYGVFKRLAVHDVARPAVCLERFHQDKACLVARVILARVDGWNARAAHGRDADDLHGRGHRVGRVLPAACAGAGTGMILDGQQLLVADLARCVRPDRLEHVLDGDIDPVDLAWQDGAAVEEHRRHVDPGEPHRAARDGLVAGHQRDDAVEHVAAAGQFDGVRDNLAADQRSLHPLGAHGDAVAHGDGVELHRRATRGPDALLDLHGQVPQVEVARHRLDPGVGDADDRLGQIFVAEADRFEHRAGRRPVPSVGDGCACVFEWIRHGLARRSEKRSV